MKISIATRYRPFSHLPGATCLLPKTGSTLQAFPTLLRLASQSGEKQEIPLPFSGPVKDFTFQQDLEQGCLWVWGTAKEGRFRFRLEADQEMLLINGAPSFPLSGPRREAPAALERISFGSHKAQDWDAAARRADPREILPVLFALSQWIPQVESPPSAMFDLLEKLDEDFFRAAFFSILCPRLTDDQHQGLLPKETIAAGASPLALITQAGMRIREKLVLQRGNQIAFPLPKQLSGRMVNAELKGIGLLDFEWRQGQLRRAVLHAEEDAELSFLFPREVRTFRLRTAQHERGEKMDGAGQWRIEKGAVYFLDRFEK